MAIETQIPDLMEKHDRNFRVVHEEVQQQFGISICKLTLQNFLKDTGLYLDADACHFSLTPSIRYAWQKKGGQILLPSAKSIVISVFGLITPDCKLFSKTFQGTLNSEKIIGVLMNLLKPSKNRQS